jgi:hypothetical protein
MKEAREAQKRRDAGTIALAWSMGIDLGVIPPDDRSVRHAAIQAETEMWFMLQRIKAGARYSRAVKSGKAD